jgi:D-3-phosphoglycerate dehydrogenase
MTGPRVLITCRQMQGCFDHFRERFEELGIDVDMPAVVQQPTEEELIKVIGDYEGMIAGDDPLTANVLARAHKMKVISKWGVGVDGIDVDAARASGIAVTNTPGVFGDDVADVAAAYLVMLARQLHRIHASVREGGWWKHEGILLAGKTLGVSGFGTIGRAVARRGQGFGMNVIAYDVADAAVAAARDAGVEPVARDDLFRRSDFLVLCNPLTAETRHIVNSATLELMKHGSFVVNVARGPLIHEAALVDALSSGRIAAAGLDVFEDEPLPEDSPLRAFEQCVFGSHNGSNTSEGVLRASALAVENLLAGIGVP